MIPDTMTGRYSLGVSYDDGCGRLNAGCIELRSGAVTLMNGSGSRRANLRVMLKVYRTSLEHFAVLYPDKLATCCKPIGFVNLKHCNVGAWRRTLQISQRNCDGGVLTFDCSDAKDAKMWLEVMENNCSSSSSATSSHHKDTDNKSKQMRMNICTNLNLPIVQEEEVDEE